MDTLRWGEVDMKDKILEILREYLAGGMDIDALEDQVIPLAWSVEGEDADLIDEVAAELAYVKDKVSDESTFKTRIAGILTRQRVNIQPVSG